jgi:hypothetical protein
MADNANGDHPHFETPAHERTWIDEPKNVDRIVYALYGLCVLLIVIDPFVHKHSPFSIEHYWGFYAFYGFVACVGLVLTAKMLRKILIKPEDYYDR